MSIPSITPVKDQASFLPDLTRQLENFDRKEKLLVLLNLSTKLKGDNLESTIFSAILDQLCDDDELFCAIMVEAMYTKFSHQSCLKFLHRLNHKLASNVIDLIPKAGGDYE